MPSGLIPTFIIYCFVTAITPGPANLCSLASAMAYGRKQALVQWRGIFTGYAIVAFTSSLAVWFLGIVVNKYIYVLTWIGAAYILWLAWHILRSSDVGQAKAGKHCNFYTGPIANLVWLFTGAGMQRFFMKYQKPVNIVMAISLVICAISIVMN